MGGNPFIPGLGMNGGQQVDQNVEDALLDQPVRARWKVLEKRNLLEGDEIVGTRVVVPQRAQQAVVADLCFIVRRDRCDCSDGIRHFSWAIPTRLVKLRPPDSIEIS